MKKEEYIKFLQTNLNTWFNKFEPCIFNEDFILMFKNIKKVRESMITYPSVNNMFDSFKYCDFNNLKVVIINNKPFKHKEAKGLAFSYNSSFNGPYSTVYDKFHNLVSQYNNGTIGWFSSPDFTYLAKQGVLMLNCELFNTEKTLKKNIFKPFIDYLFHNVLRFNTGIIILRFNDDYIEYCRNPFHINIKSITDIYNPYKPKVLTFDDCFKVINNLIEKQNGAEYKIEW
jgi:uracil DNA glycosylase